MNAGGSPIEAALLPFRLRVYSLILSSPSEHSEGGAASAVEGHPGEEGVVVEHVREGVRSGPLTFCLALTSCRALWPGKKDRKLPSSVELSSKSLRLCHTQTSPHAVGLQGSRALLRGAQPGRSAEGRTWASSGPTGRRFWTWIDRPARLAI